jgi:activating signal cointegrator complex subunit 2
VPGFVVLCVQSLQESAIEAVKEQLTEVVEYLNDVIITLDAFVRAYPPAASILISAGVSSNSIGMFLSAIAAIHNNFLPVLSTGFIILASPPLSSSDGKTNIEVTSQHQLKQLKMRLVNFAWKLLSTCYLGDKDVGIPTDNPSLGANYGGSTLMEDPGMKGGLLVQAVVSLSMELTESDRDGVLGSLSSVSQSSSMGGLLQSLDKHHGLCEKIHELCNSGNTVKLWPSDFYILVLLQFVQMRLV